MVPQKHPDSEQRTVALTIPDLEQSKAAVLNTLASVHSRRSYAFAIDRFVAWYCSEPRLTFNRAVVVRYRSYLESLSLSAATINLSLSAIRRLADESAESGWLTPELAIGIRRVQAVKRLTLPGMLSTAGHSDQSRFAMPPAWSYRSCPPRPYNPPLRFWTLTRYPNYAIVYRPETAPLEIVAVTHGKRNRPRC